MLLTYLVTLYHNIIHALKLYTRDVVVVSYSKTMAEQGPSLNDILSQYALKETDLSKKCPREVRNEIAIKLDDWKMMIGYSLGFPKEKLTSIGRENETQDLCKVTLLDFWSKREGEGA